jgi:hypothetical protein
MSFLDFYTLDLTTIVIILMSSLIIYAIINYMTDEKDQNKLNIAGISLGGGIVLSLFYSYITLESDIISSANYWD